MALTSIFRNYTYGYIVNYVSESNKNSTTVYCTNSILFPSESLWPHWFRTICYLYGLLNSFAGVAVGSDVFMTSIAVITSRKRTILVYDEQVNEHKPTEVYIWNETVANLTLLALGSSAPEILLATIETINQLYFNQTNEGSGSLGFYTIIGSAAFNLLVITSVCVVSIPSPNYKRVEQFGVFLLTSISSLFAYFWLLIVTEWNSKGKIEVWEAILTLVCFPVLVLTAYATDNGWWSHKWLKSRAVADVNMKKQDQSVISGIGSRRGSIGGQTVSLNKEERRQTQPNIEPPLLHQQDNENFAPAKTRRNVRSLSIVAPDEIKVEAKNIFQPIEESSTAARNAVAKARFRHAAIRLLGRVRCYPLDRNQTDSSFNHQPKLLSVVSKLTATRRIYSRNQTACAFPLSQAIFDDTSGRISFAASSYYVLENAGEIVIEVLLHRQKKPKNEVTISSHACANSIIGMVSVDFETREGTAKINKDFEFTSGTLIFTEDDFVRKINIPIIDDHQYNPDTDFYVILKNPTGDVSLGDPSVTRITIIDDDCPGDFVMEKSQLYADMSTGEATATVLRHNGCDGEVKVHYTTIDGSATGGEEGSCAVDFVHTSGVLCFEHQQTSNEIKVQVNKNVKTIKNFVISLRNPSIGSHLGEHSAAVINLNLQPGELSNLSRVLIEENDTSWRGQFISAMEVGGEIDEYGNIKPPTIINYILHYFTLFWKLVFAFTPPRNFCGGYPAFIVSMALIGVITAIIEKLGNVLGCVTGLSPKTTGLIIIAMGTSLPDTIASQTAALQDESADAAIGNITGSNSVNVFLGLGLPWVIRTTYNSVYGGVFKVNTNGLRFCVALFDSLGAVCLGSLVMRRFLLGGELGGKVVVKWLSGIFLFLLWTVFVFFAITN